MFSASALLQQCDGAGGEGIFLFCLFHLVVSVCFCLQLILFVCSKFFPGRQTCWPWGRGQSCAKYQQVENTRQSNEKPVTDKFCRKDFLYVIVHSSCMAEDTKVRPHDNIILSFDVHLCVHLILVTIENCQAEVCELIQRAVTLFNWRSPRAPPRQTCKHCLWF